MKLVDTRILNVIDSHTVNLRVTVQYEDDYKLSDYEGTYNLLKNSFNPDIENAYSYVQVKSCVEQRNGLTSD